MQQQSAMEEGTAYEPPTYDKIFPTLPETSSFNSAGPRPNPTINSSMGSMRVGCSFVTQVYSYNRMKVQKKKKAKKAYLTQLKIVSQVFHVPVEERKFDHSDKFGEGESKRTCQLITKETGAHIEISSSKNQSLTFLVTGKNLEVMEARRRILQTFQTQATRQMNIPKEYHKFLLGKQGQKLKDLEKNTATKINVPHINDNSDIITITGTKEGIEKAEHEIRVISDEQSRRASETVIIPKIYHPFIAGASNETMTAISEETGARINIPPISVQKNEISIAGEKEGVLAAKQKIEAIYKDMEKRCTTVSVEVPKSQHKYVIGPRGSTIAEILKLTGVSVEMPAATDSATGTITLRGPQEKLGQALDKVYEKANSVRTVVLDVPAWIHKYIIGPKGASIKKISQDLPKVQVEFSGKENKIIMEGPPEEVEKAQNEIGAKAKELISKLTFVELNVDPKHYKHIIGKQGSNINRLKEETGVVINISEDNGSSIIRIEGTHSNVVKAQTVSCRIGFDGYSLRHFFIN